MYQLLQVFTSFSFSLIDNVLSRSIKVGQALSRRCRKVTETSPKSRGDVVSTFCQSPWSPLSLRREYIKLLRRLRDLLET